MYNSKNNEIRLELRQLQILFLLISLPFHLLSTLSFFHLSSLSLLISLLSLISVSLSFLSPSQMSFCSFLSILSLCDTRAFSRHTRKRFECTHGERIRHKTTTTTSVPSPPPHNAHPRQSTTPHTTTHHTTHGHVQSALGAQRTHPECQSAWTTAHSLVGELLASCRNRV